MAALWRQHVLQEPLGLLPGLVSGTTCLASSLSVYPCVAALPAKRVFHTPRENLCCPWHFRASLGGVPGCSLRKHTLLPSQALPRERTHGPHPGHQATRPRDEILSTPLNSALRTLYHYGAVQSHSCIQSGSSLSACTTISV